MVSQVLVVCWRQLLQFSPPRNNMWWSFKMCVTIALCLVSLVTLSEGFFLPASLRKQPDCARRAPQTTSFNSQHWIPTQNSGNSVNGVVQSSYGSLKDINPYQQQQQQQPQQQVQQQHPQQQVYGSQHTNPGLNAPQKYEPTPYQTVNQPQYAYDGGYQSSLSSYPQSVQLVPCLCPVSKEVIEQQSQQLHAQTSLPVAPTSPSFPSDAAVVSAAAVAGSNLVATPPGNQKKSS